jgi:hypothetical protein
MALSKLNSLIEILINLIDHPLIVNSVIISYPMQKMGGTNKRKSYVS